jgi:hypothetical protein
VHPRYGLTTSTVVSESNGVPDKTTAIKYGETGLDPVYSLATSASANPVGLNITGRTGFDLPKLAVNAAITATGGVAGRIVAGGWRARNVVQQAGKVRPGRVHGRHRMVANWRATARNWGKNAYIGGWQYGMSSGFDAGRSGRRRR